MRQLTLFAIVLFVLVGSAGADPFHPDLTADGDLIPTAKETYPAGFSKPNIYDAVNRVLGPDYDYQENDDLDDRFVPLDYVWKAAPTGQIALIGMSAGNTNTLGYYTDLGSGLDRVPLLQAEPGTYQLMGYGTLADPFPAYTYDVGGGQQHGWYLESVTSNDDVAMWYSEPELNLVDGWDHMMTFALPELAGKTIYIKVGDNDVEEWTFREHVYLLAWEDVAMGGDFKGDMDYDDMMYLVDVGVPVPVPGAVLLGVLGLSVAGARLRRRS